MSGHAGGRWEDLHNRTEHVSRGGEGARICEWEDSSCLTVAKVFPRVGGRLLRHCLREWPFLMSQVMREENSVPPVSVVLPVGDKDRVGLLNCVLRAFGGQTVPNMEIIVVEHAEKPSYGYGLPESAKYIFISRTAGRQFNKSAALNEGVRQSASPVVILHDADIVPPATYVESVIDRLGGNWDAVRPLRLLFCLEEDSSETFCMSSVPKMPKEVGNVMQNFPGASMAIRKEVYEDLGGHDEDFEGWGGEDLEFLDRLRTTNLYPGSYAPGLHLWHPAAENKSSGDRNNLLLSEKRMLTPEERIEGLLKRNGRGGRHGQSVN
jgi:hypothetical protein